MPTRAQFSSEIREWMGRYRGEILRRPDMGSWRNRPYPHILSADDCRSGLNLLQSIRPNFAQYQAKKKLKLHRDFAHLNSSQALAFNLFFPFLPPGESGLTWAVPERITGLLELSGLVESEFERIENPAEGTNLDWWASCEDDGRVFCEVKFTESSFGTASSPTTDYRDRLERLYRPRLVGVIKPGLIDDLDWFEQHYQILRNLAHLLLGHAPERNRVLFVLPERSPTYAHLVEFLNEHLEPSVEDRVVVWGLETLTDSLESSSTSQEERQHWQEFRTKYCPPLP